MPVKIRSRFATAMETAEVLGVPRHRAVNLIRLVSPVTAAPENNGNLPQKKEAPSIKRKLPKRQSRAKLSKAAR